MGKPNPKGDIKPGKIFENLSAQIVKTIHRSAIVTENDSMPDIHTGKNRQIDISIRIKSGPIELKGIVEARDRSRPVGVEYIEQIDSKRISVGADFAVIVSNKGFYQTAIEKAGKLNIRTFSVAEALDFDWSATIGKTIFIEEIVRLENPSLFFLNKADDKIINPHPSVLETLNENKEALILRTVEGIPLANMQSIWRGFDAVIKKHLKPGRENGKILTIIADIDFNPDLYVKIEDESDRLVDHVGFRGRCWVEQKIILPKITHFKNAHTGELTAEIVSLEINNGKEHVNLTIENPNQTDKVRRISFRTDSAEKQTVDQENLQMKFTLTKAFVHENTDVS